MSRKIQRIADSGSVLLVFAPRATVAEQVDAGDLKFPGDSRAGSIPAGRTTQYSPELMPGRMLLSVAVLSPAAAVMEVGSQLTSICN